MPADASGAIRSATPNLRQSLTVVVCNVPPAGWVVVDFETTGTIAPGNRVIEIGAVYVELAGSIDANWGTLVNPSRDIGPTRIHGIHAGDALNAPSFEELAASGQT